MTSSEQRARGHTGRYEEAAARNTRTQFGVHGSPFRSCFVNADPGSHNGAVRPSNKGERPGHSPLRSCFGCAFAKREEVGVNRVGLSRGHAVREALVGFEYAIPQQL